MFVDAYNTFSRNQEVTAEAYSDNVIDTGNLGIGDTDISLFIKVNTSVAGGNMIFALESSDTEDFAEVVVEHITKTFDAGELAAGSSPVLSRLSHISRRYLRVRYTPSATLTAGSFTARLVEGGQTNR